MPAHAESPPCPTCRRQSDNPYKEAVTYTFKWVVEATVPGVHGTLLAVQPGEPLLVAVKPREGGVVENPKCLVTWSGYHPAQGSEAVTGNLRARGLSWIIK